MPMFGYARVSTTGQSLDVQLEQLQAAGCQRVFMEKLGGACTAGRDQLVLALDFVREGDVFVVTRLDRLARSIVDLRHIVDRLAAKGVGFRCLQQGGIDTTTSEGRLLLNVLGSFAEFELDIRRERQAEGIAKAKAAGVYRGRPATIGGDDVLRLKADGLGATDIAKRLGISRASVYRLLGGGAA